MKKAIIVILILLVIILVGFFVSNTFISDKDEQTSIMYAPKSK